MRDEDGLEVDVTSFHVHSRGALKEVVIKSLMLTSRKLLSHGTQIFFYS